MLPLKTYFWHLGHGSAPPLSFQGGVGVVGGLAGQLVGTLAENFLGNRIEQEDLANALKTDPLLLNVHRQRIHAVTCCCLYDDSHEMLSNHGQMVSEIESERSGDEEGRLL